MFNQLNQQMRFIASIHFFLLAATACSQQREVVKDSLPRQQVGEIYYNAALDDPAFKVCRPDRILEYYNTRSSFKDHKKEIEQYFQAHYKSVEAPAADSQTGFLTIRFIINCEGMGGWFRLSELDSNYHKFHFDKAISGQLMTLTKALPRWQPAIYKNKVYDSYQYITFKLKKGTIECILP